MENSPSLEQYKQGIPEPPPDPAIRRKKLRIAIGILAGLIIVLSLVYFVVQRSAAAAANSGAVTGRVVLADGTPVLAEVFLAGSEQVVNTDADGRFTLANLPVGQHKIVVAFEYQGQEVAVDLSAGVLTDIGSVTVEPNPKMETAP